MEYISNIAKLLPPPPIFSMSSPQTTIIIVFAQKCFSCPKSANKVIVRPKEMLLSLSIGTFLANYDVTNRNHYIDLIYSIVQKWTIWERNKSMETSISLNQVFFFWSKFSLSTLNNNDWDFSLSFINYLELMNREEKSFEDVKKIYTPIFQTNFKRSWKSYYGQYS